MYRSKRALPARLKLSRPQGGGGQLINQFWTQWSRNCTLIMENIIAHVRLNNLYLLTDNFFRLSSPENIIPTWGVLKTRHASLHNIKIFPLPKTNHSGIKSFCRTNRRKEGDEMMKEWRRRVGERRGLLLLSCDGGVVLQLEDEVDRVQHVTHAVGGVLNK